MYFQDFYLLFVYHHPMYLVLTLSYVSFNVLYSKWLFFPIHYNLDMKQRRTKPNRTRKTKKIRLKFMMFLEICIFFPGNSNSHLTFTTCKFLANAISIFIYAKCAPSSLNAFDSVSLSYRTNSHRS